MNDNTKQAMLNGGIQTGFGILGAVLTTVAAFYTQKVLIANEEKKAKKNTEQENQPEVVKF